jgi:hypothetical protein
VHSNAVEVSEPIDDHAVVWKSHHLETPRAEPGGRQVLRLIQIRITDAPSAENSACLSIRFASHCSTR